MRYKIPMPEDVQPKKKPQPKKKTLSVAQRLRMQALKTIHRFDPRDEGKTVFISPGASNAKALKGLKLVAPFEKVLTMATAALVIVPSLHVGSNLRSENMTDLDLDPLVLNCVIF